MELLEHAKKIEDTYGTAHNYWKKGLLKGCRLPTSTIIIELEEKEDRV